MEFTKEEREVLKNLIKKQLAELKQNESMLDQSPAILGSEIKYDKFLTKLLKKLN